jgi:hypothetical protein
MAGTRKYSRPIDEDVKFTMLLPPDLDRQLRMLAARRGQPVGPIVREWITEKLREAGKAGEANKRAKG